jgi:putative addiction module killer protein
MELTVRKLQLENGRIPFDEWFDSLDDVRTQAVVTARLVRVRVRAGNLGDCKAVGGGVFELRIDFGPGLRIYFGRQGREIVVLVAGGTKRTQANDIALAQRLWKQV